MVIACEDTMFFLALWTLYLPWDLVSIYPAPPWDLILVMVLSIEARIYEYVLIQPFLAMDVFHLPLS